MKYILLLGLGLVCSIIYQSQAQSISLTEDDREKMKKIHDLVAEKEKAYYGNQSSHSLLMLGDDHYQNQDYKEATQAYSYAAQKEESSLMKASYNLGNALYKQQRYDEAVKHYESAANKAEDTYLKSKSYYNLGNAHLQHAESIKERIKTALENQQANPQNVQLQEMGKQMHEAYKNAKTSYIDALKNNPQDYDAKNNLAYTQRILRKIQQQQQQNKQKQKKQQQDQNDNQDQKNQDQNQDQNQEDKPINQNPQPQNKNPQDIKKDEMQRMMQIIENEDKKAQEKLLKRIHSTKPAPDKEW